MTRTIGLLTVLSLCVSSGFGQWRTNGEVVPDTAWSKSDGDFGATLLFTDKPDELFSAWNKPTPGVEISDTSTAVRGTPMMAVVYFTGCAANSTGNCELVGRFATKTPEGKPWGAPYDMDLWMDKPAPHRGTLELSHHNLGIVIDPDDPLGVYTVRVEITDRVSKKTMILERTFTAVEAPQQH